MRQNMRVDIIYYLCDTDFEMEFNLNGCCPLRMLTGVAENKNELVKDLSRAVSRSKIIICCGSLFGEDGLTKIISASIGHTLEKVNCEEYGITTAGEINIISDSVPLVTREGYFGGCIIESGPQTIILLTENRSIRKSLMSDLIHPYIEDMSYQPDLQERMKSSSARAAEQEQEKKNSWDMEAEKAAADAAKVVAAALGETAATTATVVSTTVSAAAEAVSEIEDISSTSEASFEEEKPQVEEMPQEAVEEIEGVEEAEEIEPIEEAEEAVEEIVETVEEIVPIIEEEQELEQATESLNVQAEEIEPIIEEEPIEDASMVINMTHPDDGLFVVEEQPITEEVPDEKDFLPSKFQEVELYIEPGAVSRQKVDAYAREYVPSKTDEMFLSGDDDDYEYGYEEPKKPFAINKTISVLVVLLVIILLVLGYVLIVIPYTSDLDFEQYFKELFGIAAKFL